MEEVIKIVLQQGLPGAICVGLAYALYRKDTELSALHRERVADAQKFTEQAIALQGKAIEATHRVTDLAEAAMKGKVSS